MQYTIHLPQVLSYLSFVWFLMGILWYAFYWDISHHLLTLNQDVSESFIKCTYQRQDSVLNDTFALYSCQWGIGKYLLFDQDFSTFPYNAHVIIIGKTKKELLLTFYCHTLCYFIANTSWRRCLWIFDIFLFIGCAG